MRDLRPALVGQAISFLCVAFLVATGCSGKPAAKTVEATPSGPRLYILDCGTI
jgi:hypothetical protein